MATEKRMESMESEEKGVAGERDYIELLDLFKRLKEDDKQNVNSWIKSLLSAP